MDLFAGNPDEDSMMEVEAWMPDTGPPGFGHPAADALLPSASPLPSLPVSPDMLKVPAGNMQQHMPEQPWAHQQQQQGPPAWAGMAPTQQLPPQHPHFQQQQHIRDLPPGGMGLQQQHNQQQQMRGMVPIQQQQQQQPLGYPGGPMPQQQQHRMQLLHPQQQQQLPPQLRVQLMQQQQQQMLLQSRHADSGGTGSHPPSMPGSPRGQLSRQNSTALQLDHQVSISSGPQPPAKLDAAALLAAAAPKPSRKQGGGGAQGGGGGGNKKAAAAAAAAAAAYTALWKHTGPPKEPRILREPGTEYEEVLPPGVVAANTRPLPVPIELFSLNSLSDILNLDTWHNELDESDRALLRALLPNKGEGFSEEPGGDLDALLSGSENFCFGNPTAQLWEAITTGAAAPRVRKQQELLLQIKQQLAAVAVRQYHNDQVSTFHAMQRLWDSTLPPDAPISARLAAWEASKAGELEVPESPRQAVQTAWAEAVHKTADAEQPHHAVGDRMHQRAAHAAAQQQQMRAQAAAYPGGQGHPHGGPHQRPQQQMAAAAAARTQGGIVGSGQSDFVYETGVNFAQHLTKRQQAALAQQQQQQQGGAGLGPGVSHSAAAAATVGGGGPRGTLTTPQQQQQLLQQLEQLQRQQQQGGMQGRAVPVAGSMQQQQQAAMAGAAQAMPPQLQYRMAAQQLQLQQAAMQQQQQLQQQLQQQARAQMQQLPPQQQQQLQQLLMQQRLQQMQQPRQ